MTIHDILKLNTAKNLSSDLYIGLLSGTSMDAIDCALVDFSATLPKLILAQSFPIPDTFRHKCLQITHSGICSIDGYGMLDVEAGELFAEAVLNFLVINNIPAKSICAVGSHGQTLRHRPNLSPPFTLQIGDPHTIAERTGITVVADVRKRDLAAGGQGAPLAPAFHQYLFRHSSENRIIINIGGISNISLIPSVLTETLLGYDIGPGNGLLDAWISKTQQLRYDHNGAFAASGMVVDSLLSDLLKDPYFDLAYPKSTGKEYFNLLWLENYLQNYAKYPAEDIQATLVELTACSIANAILQHVDDKTAVYVCGGGVKNPVLMLAIANRIQRPIQTTEVLGVPADWIEAMLFAWIAKQTLQGMPSNCPSVTGSGRFVPLGGIFPAF